MCGKKLYMLMRQLLNDTNDQKTKQTNMQLFFYKIKNHPIVKHILTNFIVFIHVI